MAIEHSPPPPPQGQLPRSERVRLPRPVRALSTVEQWFWSKVDRSGGPNACWPWLRAKNNKGYGHLWVGPRKGGRTQLAHRVAVVLSGRELKKDEVVCHTCDNRPCCNPRHLEVGGHSQNLIDMYQRFRRPRLPKPLVLRNILASAKSALAKKKKASDNRWSNGKKPHEKGTDIIGDEVPP